MSFHTPVRRLSVPASCAKLDLGRVELALIKHHANVRAAARELKVPSGDLRQLTWSHPRLIELALEEAERLVDRAEERVREALDGANPDRALSAATFILSHHRAARERGWSAPPAATAPTTIRRRRRSRFAGSAICTVILRLCRLRQRNECGRFRRRRRPQIGETLMRRTPGAFIDARRARRGAVAGITSAYRRAPCAQLRCPPARTECRHPPDAGVAQPSQAGNDSAPYARRCQRHPRRHQPLGAARAREKTMPSDANSPSWPKAYERILASINNGRSLYAAGVRFIRRKAYKSTSLTVKLSGPRSVSASKCSRIRRLELTLTGHTGPPARPRTMEEQSSREFASADPTARAQDGTLQERRVLRKNSSPPTPPLTTFSTSNAISRQLSLTASYAPRR